MSAAQPIPIHQKHLRPAPQPLQWFERNEKLIPIAEAARRSSLCLDTLYNRIKAGKLQAYGTRNAYRVFLSDVLPPVPQPSETIRKGKRKAVFPGQPQR